MMRAVAGFAHECSAAAAGPTGARMRGRGLGAALLFRCLESMRDMGYGYAVIGGVGPAAFYEKVCGAFVIPGSETGVYRSVYEELRDRQAADQQAPSGGAVLREDPQIARIAFHEARTCYNPLAEASRKPPGWGFWFE
jgi:hypothetical protein